MPCRTCRTSHYFSFRDCLAFCASLLQQKYSPQADLFPFPIRQAESRQCATCINSATAHHMPYRDGKRFACSSRQVNLGTQVGVVRSLALTTAAERVSRDAGSVTWPIGPQHQKGGGCASTHNSRRTLAVRLRQSRIPPHLMTKLTRHSNYRRTQR